MDNLIHFFFPRPILLEQFRTVIPDIVEKMIEVYHDLFSDIDLSCFFIATGNQTADQDLPLEFLNHNSRTARSLSVLKTVL